MSDFDKIWNVRWFWTPEFKSTFIFFLGCIFWPLEGFKVGKMSVFTKTSRYFDLEEIEKK